MRGAIAGLYRRFILREGASKVFDVAPNARALLGGEAHGVLTDSERLALDVRVARASVVGQYCAVISCALTAFSVLAIILAYMQWQDDLEARRDAQSLRYIERMLEDPVYTASFNAGSALAAAREQEQTDLMAFASNYYTDDTGRRAIITLLVFYDSFAKCIEQNLCTRSIIEPFLGSSDKLIFRASCGFINEARRGGDTTFARSAEAFFNVSCADDAPLATVSTQL